MFAVEIYAAVRRFVFIEGNSRREAARVWTKPGHDREDVPLFGAAGLRAHKGAEAAEARAAAPGD